MRATVKKKYELMKNVNVSDFFVFASVLFEASYSLLTNASFFFEFLLDLLSRVTCVRD